MWFLESKMPIAMEENDAVSFALVQWEGLQGLEKYR